jgi:hypothetical protein
MKHLALLLSLCPLWLSARDIQLRAYLHHPTQPVQEAMEITTAAGEKLPLIWRNGEWSERMQLSTDAAELLFLAKDGLPAAKANIPANTDQLLIILVPETKADAKLPFRAMTLDASASAFPWGTSQAVSLLGQGETAVQAGEHRIAIHAASIAKIPAVTKRDDFHMAQVNFYYRENNEWVPFTERRLQFVDDMRRVFLIYSTPGAQQPFVTTLIDHQPRREPGT